MNKNADTSFSKRSLLSMLVKRFMKAVVINKELKS